MSETWFSPDLRMVMESTQSDPRFGQTTYIVTDLDQSDPDKRMFQVPPGYTLQTTPVYATSQYPPIIDPASDAGGRSEAAPKINQGENNDRLRS